VGCLARRGPEGVLGARRALRIAVSWGVLARRSVSSLPYSAADEFVAPGRSKLVTP
jgi:hypothetical protein